jgi:hypothetical protein
MAPRTSSQSSTRSPKSGAVGVVMCEGAIPIL